MDINYVTLVSSDDDWEALYINNDLVIQEHKIRVSDALNKVALLDAPFEVTEFRHYTSYLEDHGDYPKSYTELLEGLKNYDDC